MPKSTRGRAVGNRLGRPADSWIDDLEELAPDADKEGYERMLQAIREYPELNVVSALTDIADLGFDSTDPAAIEKAVENARRSAAYHEQYQLNKLVIRRSHDPVVYYMRVGNRVKIGTTANIMARLDAVAPEELVTMEWGARALGTQATPAVRTPPNGTRVVPAGERGGRPCHADRRSVRVRVRPAAQDLDERPPRRARR